jgi:hypothetical protein
MQPREPPKQGGIFRGNNSSYKTSLDKTKVPVGAAGCGRGGR